MSDHDRGAYTPPTDDPLAFDARVTHARRPVPLTLVASGVVLVVMVVAVVLFYRSGVRGANEPPRVVGESVAEMKSAPVEEARPIDQAAGLEVYVDDQPLDATPTFAPPPEQPRPRPAAPVAVSELPSAQPAESLRPAAPAAPTPVQAKAAPTPPAPQPAPAPVRTAEAATPPAASVGASVQIGAFSSAAVADSEFAKVRSAFAQYTSGRGKRVEPVERDGQTLYRTAFTGFPSKSEAQAFCSALKAAGRACIVR